MFGKFGIRSMTMDDISRQLGISKKTLYQHVEDKADLVNRVIDLDIGMARDLADGLDSPDTNAIASLIAINEQILRQRRYLSPTFRYDLRKYYPEAYRHWTGEKRRFLERIIVANMDRGKAEDLYRKELEGSVIADLYISYVSRMEIEDPIESQGELSDDELREIFIYHLHGICSRSGIEYLKQNTDMSNEQRSNQ